MVPIPSRRRLATLIRIRQEVDKRLDRLIPRRIGPTTVADVLAPNLSAIANDRDPDVLRLALASAAAARFPRSYLRNRDVTTLPASAELARSIRDAAAGRWTLFGSDLTIAPATHQWTRHPHSKVMPSGDHWTSVAYFDGVGGGDVKSIWELNRHHHLVRLAQGYAIARDRTPVVAETYAGHAVAMIDRWIDQNPNGFGINWTSSLEVAFRVISWCWVWSLTCDSHAWTPERVRRFLLSVWHHARHVERYDSIHHSPNTHLTGEGLGLMYVGLLFPELKGSKRWGERGREILESELEVQVLGDGMHYERSIGYHKYTAEFYVHYLVLMRAFGLPVPNDFRAAVEAQVRVAAALRRPDGTWPIIGDEDSGDTLLLAPVDPQDEGPLLAVGAGLFRDASLIPFTTDAHRAAAWWLLDDADWEWVRESARTVASLGEPLSVALPRAGYFVGADHGAESGWWCLVDAGPHGGETTGHAHTDLGHVEIAHGDTHIVVDPGCAEYTLSRAARDHARSDAAHACLVVAAAPLATPAGPFSWSRVAPTPTASWGDDGALWWCELSYRREHASGHLTHRRQVVLVRRIGVVVCDWIDDAGDASLALHWPLGDVPNDDALHQAALATDDYLIGWSASGGQLVPTLADATRSPGYGRRVAARVLRLEYRGRGAVSFVSVFSNPAMRLGRHLHNGQAVQVELPVDDRGQLRTLVIHAGASPTIDVADAPAHSFPVTR